MAGTRKPSAGRRADWWLWLTVALTPSLTFAGCVGGTPHLVRGDAASRVAIRATCLVVNNPEGAAAHGLAAGFAAEQVPLTATQSPRWPAPGSCGLHYDQARPADLATHPVGFTSAARHGENTACILFYRR